MTEKEPQRYQEQKADYNLSDERFREIYRIMSGNQISDDEVRAFGNMAKDSHTVIATKPEVKIESVGRKTKKGR